MAVQKKFKACQSCGNHFQYFKSTEKVCSVPCSLVFAKARNAEKKRKAFNRETKRRRESLKTRRDWIKEVQPVFNRFIRLRDHYKPCVSCGLTELDLPPRHGGQWDCGHYLSTGAHPELRFNEFNAHKQCKECNNHRSGNIGKYRVELISRIGLPVLEWLEGPHEAAKFTIEELQFLKAHYKYQAKELQAAITQYMGEG